MQAEPGFLTWLGVISEGAGLLAVLYLYGRRVRHLEGMPAQVTVLPRTGVINSVLPPLGTTGDEGKVEEPEPDLTWRIAKLEKSLSAMTTGSVGRAEDLRVELDKAVNMQRVDELRFLRLSYSITLFALFLGVALQILGMLWGL